MGLRLGCDPEFFLLNRLGQWVSASSVDCVRGNIGVDGSGMQAELRCPPGPSPLWIVAGLALRLRRFWYAGGNAYRWVLRPDNWDDAGAGGHVHFSGVRRVPTSWLDFALRRLEDEGIISADLATWRRDETSYGRWGETRIQSWGIEYRSPHSWVQTPEAALVTLTALKQAVMLGAEFGTTHTLRELFEKRQFQPDCALALRVLEREASWKSQDFWGSNFAGCWGCSAGAPPLQATIREEPFGLAPDARTVEGVRRALLGETPWRTLQLTSTVREQQGRVRQRAAGSITSCPRHNLHEIHLTGRGTGFSERWWRELFQRDLRLLTEMPSHRAPSHLAPNNYLLRGA